MKLYLHSGNFHADDVFCCAFLRLYGMELETHRVPEISEEMKKEAMSGSAIIADIGEIYDPQRNMFDHHQYSAPVRKDGTRYAAFGLLVLNFWKDEWSWKEKFENEFVKPIDATDNGQGNFVVSTAYIHYDDGSTTKSDIDFNDFETVTGAVEAAYNFEFYDEKEPFIRFEDLNGTTVYLNTNMISFMELPLIKTQRAIIRGMKEMIDED